MPESFERYAIERNGSLVRITFDQRRNATVNFVIGLFLAILGYALEFSASTMVMWVGIVWALLAAKAYSAERVTDLGDVITHRNGKKVRSIESSELTDLVLRLQWRPRKNRKQSVLPWVVELWGQERKPFVTFSFQDEQPARAFAARIGEVLQRTPVERLERGEAVAA